jgi:hypothetical protein
LTGTEGVDFGAQEFVDLDNARRGFKFAADE